MIADRDARQHELPRFLADGNQRKVGGAAADIAHQDHVADFDLLAPFVMARFDPRIKRGLRLLQQRDFLQPRRLRRLDGQFARHRIERRRHSQNNVLRFEPMLGHVLGNEVIPGIDEMLEVVHGCFERRNAPAVLRLLYGKIGALRSTPEWHSHDFADATSRVGTCDPKTRANSPTQ